MELVSSNDLQYSIPFAIGNGISEFGPRLGGRAPAWTVGLNISGGRYFATVPVTNEPQIEASIFLDWRRFESFESIPANNIATPGREFVEIISNVPAPRADKSLFDGPITEHPLIIGVQVKDEIVESGEETSYLSGHKLGGNAHLIQPRSDLVKQLETILANGYRHVAQFDYIVPGDAAWEGTWPFGDGLFNVFGRPPFQQNDWLWLWQY